MFNLKTGFLGLTLVCGQLLAGVRAEIDYGEIIWDVSCDLVGDKLPIVGDIACDEIRKLIEIDPDEAEPVDIAVIPQGECQEVQLGLDRITEVCAQAGRLYFHLAHTWWYGCYNFKAADGTAYECCQFKYGSNGLDQYAGKFPHQFCNNEQKEGMVNPNVSEQYGVDWIYDPQYFLRQTNMAVACGADLDHVDVEKKYSQECNLHKDNFKTAIETKNDNNAHRFLKFKDGSCEIWPSKGEAIMEEKCSF